MRHDISSADIIQMYVADKLGANEIALHFGVSEVLVSGRLLKAGVSLRSVGEAKRLSASRIRDRAIQAAIERGGFGRWLPTGNSKIVGKYSFWECRCDCAAQTVKFIRADILDSGASTSCGLCPNIVEHLPDGITVIFIESDKHGLQRCSIDTADYPLVKNYRWGVVKGIKSRTMYVSSSFRHGSHILLHSVLLPEAQEVDHRDHNGLNNRRSNLREATRSQQSANTRKMRFRKGRKLLSKYKGVSVSKGRWKGGFRAYIHDGKHVLLGTFKREVDAAKAYDKAALRLFGGFAHLNFPRRKPK